MLQSTRPAIADPTSLCTLSPRPHTTTPVLKLNPVPGQIDTTPARSDQRYGITGSFLTDLGILKQMGLEEVILLTHIAHVIVAVVVITSWRRVIESADRGGVIGSPVCVSESYQQRAICDEIYWICTLTGVFL